MENLDWLDEKLKRPEGDYVVRAIAADGQIRAFAATTKNLVQEAQRRHHTAPVVTAALGRLLTAAGMMSLELKGAKDKLTLKISGDGPVQALTVVADSAGNLKGFPHVAEVVLPPKANGHLDVGGAVGAGTLTVIKDLGLKEPYTGAVELQTGEIAEDLTYYYAVSEQTPSTISLGVLVGPEDVVMQSGGFMVQLMPGVGEETISRLEKRLLELPSITTMLRDGLSPEDILAQLLGEFGLELETTAPLRFSCGCSKEKVRSAVASIGKFDLLDLMLSQEVVTAHCDYCNTDYTFDRAEMKAIYKEYYPKQDKKK